VVRACEGVLRVEPEAFCSESIILVEAEAWIEVTIDREGFRVNFGDDVATGYRH
jgi:hypothetical protein